MTKKKHPATKIGAWLLIGLAYLADQASKHYVVNLSSHLPIFSWLNVILVKNYGILWGFSQAYGAYLALFGTLGLLFILLSTDFWQRDRYAASLLIAGGLGNLTDRFLYGAVIDWIDCHAYGYHWPAFNLADSYLVIAMLLLAYRPVVRKSNAA